MGSDALDLARTADQICWAAKVRRLRRIERYARIFLSQQVGIFVGALTAAPRGWLGYLVVFLVLGGGALGVAYWAWARLRDLGGLGDE